MPGRISRPTDSPALVHRESQAAADHDVTAVVSPDAAPTEPFEVPRDELPRHVAIIMDGNRRWARARGKTEMDGHAAGVEGIREIIRHSVRRGIEVLSLYAFSRENWARSDEEVGGLFWQQPPALFLVQKDHHLRRETLARRRGHGGGRRVVPGGRV